jgi:hypothetical protein
MCLRWSRDSWRCFALVVVVVVALALLHVRVRVLGEGSYWRRAEAAGTVSALPFSHSVVQVRRQVDPGPSQRGDWKLVKQGRACLCGARSA